MLLILPDPTIITCIQQNFRKTRLLSIQFTFYLRFNPYLSAFGKGFSCQSVLLAITEEWRKALDRGEYVAAILMDLSKAFDCLSPNLITEKLIAYGLSSNAVELVNNYLSNRKQCVKIGNFCSTFLDIT